MSLDAGGLAQMTYQPHNSFNTGLGVPGSGFSSRRGGSHTKRLSMAPPSSITTITEQQQNVNSGPRTSRSHLLAGLRTAPKSPTFPTSAPPTQVQQPFGRHGSPENGQYGRGIPQTAVGGSFPNSQRYATNGNGQMFALPQILAPPTIQFGGTQEDQNLDPEYYAVLVATNQHLAQQSQRLQQQILDLTAAQQQMQGMTLNSGMGQQQQYYQSSMAPNNGFYNQQLQNGLQPVVSPVPGTPGRYTVYNPMTGQQGYVMDHSAPNQTAPRSQVPNTELSHSPPPTTPTFRAQVTPPPENILPARTLSASPPKMSPPKATFSPPIDVNPLPPPSANAFRRGHAKGLSSVTGKVMNAQDGPKSAVPKSAGFPQTPMTGSFGPGQNRAGDHPMRQPRGPPSLEELVDKPTSKHEGSKNFVTRQRRRAVHNLVRAGLDRRALSRGSNSIDSVGTPSSECDITFSISSSDNDSDSVASGSGSLSGRPSPIGSERKELKARSRDRNSTGTPFTTASLSSEDGMTIGGKLVEVKMEEKENMSERRRAPLLVLTNAEKRKSAIF
ncbi:MAG: hypothetical protein ASARMPRED_002859 [Alectoria sarmentosa]|nr:MAG: hypothetical protein ASARMPRED_002859 [Alectoria sarmentosa]